MLPKTTTTTMELKLIMEEEESKEEEEENLRCLFCVAFVVHFRYLLNLFYMHTHIYLQPTCYIHS